MDSADRGARSCLVYNVPGHHRLNDLELSVPTRPPHQQDVGGTPRGQRAEIGPAQEAMLTASARPIPVNLMMLPTDVARSSADPAR